MFEHVRWRALFCCAARLAFGLWASPAAATPTASPVGTWSTENGHGVVAIEPCGDAICGRIVGIDRGPVEPMPTDVQGRSQCGLLIITNEQPTADGAWSGRITDPRDGATYRAKLWVDAAGILHVRGFIGIPLLGYTQIWRPFAGHLTADCGMA